MWSKIKNRSIPISLKLTILYSVILSCILLLISALTVAGLYYVLYTQADEDISLSANGVIDYLTSGKPADQHLMEANLLVPGVVLRVFDEQNRLLVDNSTGSARTQTLANNREKFVNPSEFLPLSRRFLGVARINHTYFFYTKETVWQNGHFYQIQLMKPLTEQIHFVKNLVKSLAVTNFLGLFIAVISGMYMSRKILRPIRDVTNTAKKIEVTDLSERINLSGSNDELQELARTFNHMLSRIQTGFEQQRRFVADASHELRTPITVISGYADMLDRWGKQDPSVLEEGIGAIKSEAANMNELIEKLLFLARIDQGTQAINKTKLETVPLLEGIAQETRLIAASHHIELFKNDPAIVCADPIYLKEMLRIFIENSIKYTPAGGTIIIASQRDDRYLEISVQDTGIGIPLEQQTKIFDRFYRVDKSRSKATGGTGLGLSIARWIADQHDSTIQVTSKPGEGTIVTISVPLSN